VNSSSNSKTSAQHECVDRKTQRARILRVLIDAGGAWVPLPEIENKTEEIDGARHSWFHLVSSPTLETPRSAAPPAATEPEWKHRPCLTGRPLFDQEAVR
jgi:hypothetical protein